MAKSNNYGVAPWSMMPAALNDFALVTELNRKNAIVLGRILYFIEKSGSKYSYKGAVSVNPRLMKGKWWWPHYPWAIVPKDVQNKTHYQVSIMEDEDYNAWKSYYDKVITDGINNQTLYIRPSDKILIYQKID